ncbi:MAG: glycoside hydrolase family 78 protein [Arthrobacter sp.]|nr:glycoside hydrolase family 78 protein [Arthrobacter sp.]
MWNSGKVESSEQVDIHYAGVNLSAQHRYYWEVRVWDSTGRQSDWSAAAWFETALDPGEAWPAQWIGGMDPTQDLKDWRDYSVRVDFTIDNIAMGVYLRSKDVNNGYMWQITVADGTPRLRAHKKKYSAYSVIREKDISRFVTTESLRTSKHTLGVELSGNSFVTTLDGQEIDRLVDDSYSEGYVGFRQAELEQGQERASVQKLLVKASDGSTLLDSNFGSGSPLFPEAVTEAGTLKLAAPLDTLHDPGPSMPLFRKEFSAGQKIVSARLYASARGVYQVNINGQAVGDGKLEPGWTDYSKRIMYQTYDVTTLVKQGINVVSAFLGEGWYSGNIGGFGAMNYGNRPSLTAQLRLDFSDGSHQTLGTDSSWQTVPGPLTRSDLIMGETFDQRKMPPGWTGPGFSGSALGAAKIVDPPAGVVLEPQVDAPVRTVQQLTPKERTEPESGKWIYDMGQNMVGVVSLRLRGQPGQVVRIRYGEMLNKDGTLYTANLRSAQATDRYIFRSADEIDFTPMFTFHGFRYVEITGVGEPPALGDISGQVWSSVAEDTGSFSTSNALLNQLQSNIKWSQRGNFLSVPMDTPARDERLGWTGDIGVFAPTATYNSDSLSFLAKWLSDLRDAQLPGGDFPGIAPSVCACFQGGAGWSDASISVTHSLWRAYGSVEVIRDNYAMMKKFMQFRINSASPAGVVVHGDYGDWLNLGDPTDPGLIGTAYFAYTARLLADMAAAIGETEDSATYAALAARTKEDFIKAYVQGNGSLVYESQTAYAIAIGMDLVPPNLVGEAGNRLASLVSLRGGHLATGFLGTPWLLGALSTTGHADLAFAMLNDDTYPSWGYEVARGATTMWERWDGVRTDGTLGDPRMNSYNHYAYGAVGDWMYQNIAGISPATPGYKTFVIAPRIGGGLTNASGAFDSVYGRIESSWRVMGADVEMTISVPPNTKATVYFPAKDEGSVTESQKRLSDAEGVKLVDGPSGEVTAELGSGHYDFTIRGK